MTLLEKPDEKYSQTPDFFLVGLGEEAWKMVFSLVYELRRAGIWAEMDYELKGLKAQMKKADRLGAKKVFIMGENEIAAGKGVLRDMKTKAQQEISLDGVVKTLKAALEPNKTN